MSELRAVLFDMDGVLIDSERYWEQYWEDEVFPKTASGDPTFEDVLGRNFRESIATLDERYGFDCDPAEVEASIDSMGDEIYREKVTVTPGMPALFESLREAGLAVGVASSSPRRWIELVIDGSELGPVDLVLSAEDIPEPGKPEPHIYEHAAGELGLDASACLVVEDSAHGVQAGASAGATVVRYCCDHAVDPLPEASATASDQSDLRAVMAELLDPLAH